MSPDLLLLRQGGAGELLVGVPAGAVAGLARTADGVRLALAGGGAVAAREVVELARGVAVRPLPALLRGRLPAPLAAAAGLALWRSEPLVVLAAGAEEAP
ncbi:MAG: hypothetical protein KJ058_15485 [Thermoanaerobaculia bacterium]|nr:hypothetical protein [Thermoanaerobaculia bacterium]